MAWRLAKSIEVLRKQVNELAPGRSRVADGTIGDTAHSARKSDHNPNASQVVTAIDLTHDSAHGADMQALSEKLRASRDSRIKYVIFAGRYFSPKTNWQWKTYTGPNAHKQHMHLSVQGSASLWDSTKKWDITGITPTEEEDMGQELTISKVSKNAVKKIQRKLGLFDDGIYGTGTEAAVKVYQQNADLEVTGKVDGTTAAFILDKDE